jgi:hypothetical protein
LSFVDEHLVGELIGVSLTMVDESVSCGV